MSQTVKMRDYRNKVLADSSFLSHFYMNVNYNSRNKVLSKCSKSKLGFFNGQDFARYMALCFPPLLFDRIFLPPKTDWSAAASL